ncbi:hypothetical protein D3C78_1604500 [compost metagenome]
MEVGRRRVGVAAVGGDYDAAALGGGEDASHHRQAVAVDVAVVGQQADHRVERHVLGHGDRIVLGHRGFVDWGYR